jgi:hypothetical protein
MAGRRVLLSLGHIRRPMRFSGFDWAAPLQGPGSSPESQLAMDLSSSTFRYHCLTPQPGVKIYSAGTRPNIYLGAAEEAIVFCTATQVLAGFSMIDARSTAASCYGKSPVADRLWFGFRPSYEDNVIRLIRIKMASRGFRSYPLSCLRAPERHLPPYYRRVRFLDFKFAHSIKTRPIPRVLRGVR